MVKGEIISLLPLYYFSSSSSLTLIPNPNSIFSPTSNSPFEFSHRLHLLHRLNPLSNLSPSRVFKFGDYSISLRVYMLLWCITMEDNVGGTVRKKKRSLTCRRPNKTCGKFQ